MKNKKKLLSFLLVFAMIWGSFLSAPKSVMAAEMQGDGSAADPFLIYTVVDLYNIAHNTKAHYKMMNDLDLGAYQKGPISAFSGVFDGNGYTIHNLNISGGADIGLFSSLSSATVENLTLQSPNITATGEECGSIAGTATSSTISNCYSLDGKISSSAGFTGGLIGYAYNSTFIQSCSTNDILSASTGAGGLMGMNRNSAVYQCFAAGTIQGANTVGGISGGRYADNGLTIENSYARCKIINVDTSTSSGQPGGLVSGNTYSVNNCYAVTPIKSTEKIGLCTSATKYSYFDKTVLKVDTPEYQARSTEQMYQKATYEGWDFDEIWMIDEGKDYPRLQFEKNINKPQPGPDPDPTPEKRELKIVLEPTEKLQLSINNDLGQNSGMVWNSTDTDVAAVDEKGLITALSKGTATITVESTDKAYTDSVKVLVVDDASQYRLAVDLKAGEKCKLTIDAGKNLVGKWVVMDSAIAVVSAQGKVTSLAPGLTIVTGIDENNNAVGEIYIRVR